ncbi:hypothetical protein FNV43_RR21825 [Rhamnella rubrinervis]|uniref:Uncharacterized protein n=1 Tax=Rhamnella rubrinervis TaxID=2594499 RepID=A0A8K0GUK4_9ROSA|nr:hypothetical protein FNV43_RR21825 [Rhamnella rubrinervis]
MVQTSWRRLEVARSSSPPGGRLTASLPRQARGESSEANIGTLPPVVSRGSGSRSTWAELEGLAEEAESDEWLALGEGGEPEEEEGVGHEEEAIDLIKSSVTTNQLIATSKEYKIPLNVTLRMPEEDEVPSQLGASEIAITIPTFYCGGKLGRDWQQEGLVALYAQEFLYPVWPRSRLKKSRDLLSKSSKILRLELGYSILDVVEKNRKLNVKDKTTAEACERECLSKLNRLEKQLQTTKKDKAALIANHEGQTYELEQRLEAVEKEVPELGNDYKNQLIIRFELMKEALKVVEPKFMVE